ncbi:bifunctional helix-turn-helix transcriptional regulator/GNAT family N-acetyltransferase [Sphingopyxis sp. JAI128]|uniref:bifunctional helix-turn-helix transcriptional regulator/GNAT family N-acetyltransferase n=1 Tax=Sphingopyxis sp. JAI128 TaxID=2723066 RepID=UPI0017EACFA6|nr:bifunctional helix-turn-helix transcriptional regulator/GNAT family N-acetyltransferase [Sphingopyxis sp. JAI128]MBB6425924.1 DNA-binding MarR family transcriptional regulator/GNAT superfamily N-acetyltransferase [Sphingopyxis sp. JAI128]
MSSGGRLVWIIVDIGNYLLDEAGMMQSTTSCPNPAIAPAVAALRRFNRFYTRRMGALDPHYMGSELSLIEARIFYEIAVGEPVLAKRIQEDLGVDPGYLSRIVGKFTRSGWIARGRGTDGRERPIALTDAGRAAFAALDARTFEETARLLEGLSEQEVAGLSAAVDWIADRLGNAKGQAYNIRTWGVGDMGMVTARQAILYDQAYGWGPPMEALIGEIAASFIRNFRPGREQCWIAERAGRMLGSVFLVAEGEHVARLRLLYVEPEARGLGIGGDLVTRCVEFARAAGYREIVLWTHAVLTSARKIYAAQGFEVESVETHDDFGKPEVSESWRLRLRD